ncbi:MAG TPA: beta-L-arabinofuranosidase domain-containing protein, partial [Vicinamibacterales bacterium]|nr:beta-L-arabinofuranosidase domain-containing protein [Vicinamibacterales bacterium]
SPRGTPPSGAKIEPFDYQNVRLRPSRWKEQSDAAREFYSAVPDDDILHGYRKAAGLPAPGRPLGGWCGENSYTVFGQWLSGMARMYRATGDARLRDKAVKLVTEWSRTVKPDGDAGMRHYPYDKMVCGLVDLHLYAGHDAAIPMLEKVTAFAAKAFDRSNNLADPTHNTAYYGVPQEWYTLSENLFRAYRATGNDAFKTFGQAWLYHAWWNKFAQTSSPGDAHGVHAYSHVNTFSSAAMAYDVLGDASYLRILENGYEYLQNTQTYATGGYGPNERFMAPDGSLGRALDTRSDTAEIVCGSWAGFKMARYLMRFTGEARYGDWIERLFYNGVGAALPLTGPGRNFYYGDYRVGGGMKVYNWDTFTCCSGTYIQNMADYYNLVYYRDRGNLYVNLYVPSEVTWDRPEGKVVVAQDTRYPEAETVAFTVTPAQPMRFGLRLRVPGWLGANAGAMTVKVNGAAQRIETKAGAWASVERTWSAGDTVEVSIPLTLRMEPVDRQHPDRVAVMRGPAVLILEGTYHAANFRLPERDDDLAAWLVPEKWSRPLAILTPGTEARDTMSVFRVVPPDKSPVRLKFRPFYDTGEGYPYFMYFDRKGLPYRLW